MDFDLRELEALVERAHGLGARAAEFLVTESTGTRIERRDRRSLSVTGTSSASCTVRCWLDQGRMSEVTGAPEEVEALLVRAIAEAEDAPADPSAGPVERMGTPGRGLGIDDRRFSQLTKEDRVDVVDSNELAASRVDASVRTGRFTYEDRRERRALANSKGVAIEAWNTRYDATGAVALKVPDGPITLEEHVAGRAFTSTACLPFGAALAKRALRLADETDPFEGPVRVLLRPPATATLIAWLAEAIMSPEPPPFLRGRTGQLFHRRVHVVDDGAMPGGLHTFGFDDRGVLPVPITLIREGVIDAKPVGVEEARRQGSRATGHRRAGRMRPSNLQFHAGMRSVNAHLGEQTDGPVFELETLENLEQAIDPATGALDLLTHGAIWDRQTRRGALRFVRLQGDLIEALRQVVGVASDTDRILHVDAPAMFVDGLSLTAR